MTPKQHSCYHKKHGYKKFSKEVPKKPMEEDNKLVVYEYRKDGTLYKVWRFEKINIIYINEVVK